MITGIGKRTSLVFPGLMLIFLIGACAVSSRDSAVKKPHRGKAAIEDSHRGKDAYGKARKPGERLFTHKLEWPGETLSIIAKWYTGDLKNWKVLARINRDINPKLLHVGDKISIPQDLLKTRKPLPKWYVDLLTPKTDEKSSKPISPPAAEEEEEEELKLFGPKEL